MVLPNVLVIGAMKAGTTSLYNYLAQHPQIYMSPVKEPRFFAWDDQSSDPQSQTSSSPAHTSNLEAYIDLFSGVSTETAIGEASPLYLYSPIAPERIQHYVPGAKLIAILRDPSERAFSHFLHVWQSGREPFNDFAIALNAEAERIANHWNTLWHYRQRGLYYQQLTRYYERFDRSQIKIYLTEDLRTHPTVMLKDLFQFLDVDDERPIDLSHRHNVAKKQPKNLTLHQMLTQQNPLKSFLKPLLPQQFRQKLREQVTQANLKTPQLAPSVRAELVEWYRDDILKLQSLIDRDLSHWLVV